jgi:hypothetical protein
MTDVPVCVHLTCCLPVLWAGKLMMEAELCRLRHTTNWGNGKAHEKEQPAHIRPTYQNS